MLYVVVAVGLAALIGIHELVVWIATRTIRRPWAVLLGPVAGYLVLAGFAFALYAGYGIGTGERRSVVHEAMPGFDAVGKLESGDVILEIDHVAVSAASLKERVDAAGGKPVVVTVERAGTRRDVTVKPKESKTDDGRTVWLLGVQRTSREVRGHDTSAALEAAAIHPIVGVRGIANGIYRMIIGDDEADISGPVRIVEEFSNAFATRPTIQHALEWLLLLGLYVWLALSIFDLVRLVSLSRKPDARSNVR